MNTRDNHFANDGLDGRFPHESNGAQPVPDNVISFFAGAVQPITTAQTTAHPAGIPAVDVANMVPKSDEDAAAIKLLQMIREQTPSFPELSAPPTPPIDTATMELPMREFPSLVFTQPGDTPEFLKDLAPGQMQSGRETGPSEQFYFVANNATSPPSAFSGTAADFGTSSAATPRPRGFDLQVVRRDFPLLHQRIHGRPLVWLDNAATTQKPQSVIDAVSHFYEHDNSNVHRGAHTLAARATDAYEEARRKVQGFLGASSANEIVFVRGTTEAINLVAQSYGREHIGHGDEILITTLEHHANIVPWQMLAKEMCAVLRVVPITDSGEVRLEELERLLSSRTKLVAIAHVSNVLGTILPVREITEMAHQHGARVLIDGAQAVAHAPVNVREIDADFYVFSGHKLFGPTGVGVLYGKEQLLREMQPWQGGGNMIQNVTFEEITYAEPPAKFEAGTAILAGAVGLGAAIDYVSRIGLVNMAAYEQQLTKYAMEKLAGIPGLHLIGTAPGKVGVLSFVIDGVPTEEVGRLLDLEGIAVRAGHHCAQPTLARYGLSSSVRPSLAFYNTPEEIDKLIDALWRMARK